MCVLRWWCVCSRYHDPNRYVNVTTSRYHEELAAINATQFHVFYEKERVAHIVNIIVLGLTALVYACEYTCIPIHLQCTYSPTYVYLQHVGTYVYLQ